MIASLLLLTATSAWAGAASVVTGPVLIETGQGFSCVAVNVSSRNVEDVRLTVRDSSASTEQEFECDQVLPLGMCGGVGVPAPTPDFVSCEVSSGQGPKSLRATLTNTETGASSDAR
jgi:hypothetical protein